MLKLSIIVPVYNVEQYIRPCFESIFKQGLDENDYEVIIVNDGSTDKSMEMIADIINLHNNIKVINQENQGLSIARNNGIEKASGEYIQFVDSDDLLIDNSLPYLLNQVLVSKADLVIADFIKKNDNEIIKASPSSSQKDGKIQEKTGKDLILHPLYWGYSCVWRTLYRKDFLDKHNIRFIPHICFEDVPFTRLCFVKAQHCLRVNWLLYVYRIRQRSIISSSFDKKKGMDYCTIIECLWSISKDENLSIHHQQKIRNDVFSYYSMFTYLLSSCNTIPYSEKMELINHLKKLVPDLCFNNGLKQRIVNFLYQKMPSFYITLRVLYANYLQEGIWFIKDSINNKKIRT